MNKDTSSSIQTFTYKGIGGGKMLNDISVFIVVYIDGNVLVILEERSVQW